MPALFWASERVLILAGQHVVEHVRAPPAVERGAAVTWGATARGTYGTPVAGTRVPRTYSTRGPGGKPPCASGTYPTREAGTRSPYVPNGGPGAYASAQAVTQPPQPLQVTLSAVLAHGVRRRVALAALRKPAVEARRAVLRVRVRVRVVRARARARVRVRVRVRLGLGLGSGLGLPPTALAHLRPPELTR